MVAYHCKCSFCKQRQNVADLTIKKSCMDINRENDNYRFASGPKQSIVGTSLKRKGLMMYTHIGYLVWVCLLGNSDSFIDILDRFECDQFLVTLGYPVGYFVSLCWEEHYTSFINLQDRLVYFSVSYFCVTQSNQLGDYQQTTCLCVCVYLCVCVCVHALCFWHWTVLNLDRLLITWLVIVAESLYLGALVYRTMNLHGKQPMTCDLLVCVCSSSKRGQRPRLMTGWKTLVSLLPTGLTLLLCE